MHILVTLFVCVCHVCVCYTMSVELKEQHENVYFHHVGPRDWIQILRLGNRHHDLLSHLSSHSWEFSSAILYKVFAFKEKVIFLNHILKNTLHFFNLVSKVSLNILILILIKVNILCIQSENVTTNKSFHHQKLTKSIIISPTYL